MNPKLRYDPPPIIRNYHPSDVERLRKLKIELGKKEPSADPWSLQDLEENLVLSNRLSESNAFVAEKGDLIAFLKLRPEPDIRRVVLTLVVHPDHRKKSISLKLIQRAIIRARELNVERVHINLPRRHPELKYALLEMGFRPIRRYLELRLDLSKVPILRVSRKLVRIRPFKKGEESRLMSIQNRAFAGMWGYGSNTLGDIIDRTGLPSFSSQNVLFAFDGEMLVGYCWIMSASLHRLAYGSPGRIFMIGVDPERRDRGVGKQLLLAGLSYLRRKGIRMVDLTVDRENGAARALYKSVGFRYRTSTVWYERSLLQRCL